MSHTTQQKPSNSDDLTVLTTLSHLQALPKTQLQCHFKTTLQKQGSIAVEAVILSTSVLQINPQCNAEQKQTQIFIRPGTNTSHVLHESVWASVGVTD